MPIMSSGKPICISDVTFKGMAMDNTSNGIRNNVADEKPIKTSLYDICGRETTQTRPRGIYIARKEYANGKIESYKFVSK